MSIESNTARVQHPGNGTSYSVPFVFNDDADLTVIRAGAGDSETVLVLNTDYTVSGGSGSTGTVTTTASYSDGTITVLRDVPLTQGSDYVAAGAIPAENLEGDLDKLVMLAQQLNERIDRALRVKRSDTLAGTDLDVPVAAGKLIGWNATGDGLVNYDTANSADADLNDLLNEGYSNIIYPKEVHLPTGIKVLTGSGSPEGAVAAPLGSLYLRTDGGADTIIYRKISGTGNTGWVTYAVTHDHADAVSGGNTLSSPTIADFSNAAHDHGDAAGGGGIIGGVSTISGSTRGLVITNNGTNPDSKIDIHFDEAILYDSDGKQYRATNENLIVDVTVQGANGRDTTTEESIWYFLWIIYDGTTVSGLLSQSNIEPSLPGAYTYKLFVGAVNNQSGNFITFHQRGTQVYYKDNQNVKDTGFTTQAWTAISIQAHIPSYGANIASQVRSAAFAFTSSSGWIGLSPNNNGAGGAYDIRTGGSASSNFGGALTASRNHVTSMRIYLPATGLNIFYFVYGANSTLDALGWEYE